MLRGVLGGFARGRRQTSAATLYLDFLAGLNDSRITYSGGANGTRVNGAGVIVAATTPRFDYDPVTLAARGLLVEEARTNLLTYSQDFDNAAWLTTGTTTVTANTTVSPDGAVNADTLTDSDAAVNGNKYQGATVPNDALVRAGSVFLRKTSGAVTFPGVQVQYNTGGATTTGAVTVNTNTGVTANRSGFTPSGGALVADAGAYWRVTVLHANNNSGNTACLLFVFPAVNADASGTWVASTVGSCIAWGAQLEAGSFPTSYIPTTSASVTRTADSAVMTGTNFSSWYNQSEGTFVVSGSRLVAGSSSAGVLFGVSRTGDFNNSMYAFNQTASDIGEYVLVGGGAQAFLTSSAASILVPFKYAASYATSNFASCVNGGAVNTDVSGSVPTLIDILAVGSAAWPPSNNTLNGHIRTLQYFPRRLPNTQLQTLTA